MGVVLSGVVGYAQVLRENSDFRKLYIGQVVSLLGDWFNFIAVQTLVFELTHSGLATGLAIITSTLPAFFLTPLAGSLVDRFDRRKIMIVADASRTLIALGMILVRTADQIWLIYLLMALLVVFGSFFNPASSAAIPNLVRREQLYAANALSNSTWGVMLAIGALAGGVAISLVGMDWAFVINSLSFAFSAAMLLWIRRPFSETHPSQNVALSPFAHFNQGLAYARQRPQTLALLTVKAGGALAGGVILLLTIFSFEVFQVGAIGIGLLQLARGVGILLGPLVVAPLVAGRIGRAQQVIALGFFVAGCSYVLFGATPALPLAMIAVVCAHLGWGSNWSLSATLLQELTPDQLRGRIFSIDSGLFTLTSALSTFLTGVAADRFDPRLIAFGLGATFVGFGAAWSGAVFLSRRRGPQKWREGSLHGLDLAQEAWAVVEQEPR
jgi:MFS family permease